MGSFAVIIEIVRRLIKQIDSLQRSFYRQKLDIIQIEECLEMMLIAPETGYLNLEDDIKKIEEDKPVAKPQTGIWQRSGQIKIQNLKIKYRDELDYVLKGVSLELEAGDKLGVVGRTGAGKTTFLYSLYRYFDFYEGNIFIGGEELRKVGLKELRNGITVISQEVNLMRDTVYNNLDPLRSKDKEQCVEILKEVNLWGKFKEGLESELSQGGDGLSQGEKQLFCLARALLHKTEIVLLDEPTASVDLVTDSKIQFLLKKKLENCTVITVAHRLETVMSCNKILVLEAGRIVEFGKLKELVLKKKSRFAEMIKKMENNEKSDRKNLSN